MANIKFEIIDELGALTDFPTWNKHVRVVAWNGGQPKIDIRTWQDELNHPAKGIALTDDEAFQLCQILEKYFAEKEREDTQC